MICPSQLHVTRKEWLGAAWWHDSHQRATRSPYSQCCPCLLSVSVLSTPTSRRQEEEKRKKERKKKKKGEKKKKGSAGSNQFQFSHRILSRALGVHHPATITLCLHRSRLTFRDPFHFRISFLVEPGRRGLALTSNCRMHVTCLAYAHALANRRSFSVGFNQFSQSELLRLFRLFNRLFFCLTKE